MEEFTVGTWLLTRKKRKNCLYSWPYVSRKHFYIHLAYCWELSLRTKCVEEKNLLEMSQLNVHCVILLGTVQSDKTVGNKCYSLVKWRKRCYVPWAGQSNGLLLGCNEADVFVADWWMKGRWTGTWVIYSMQVFNVMSILATEALRLWPSLCSVGWFVENAVALSWVWAKKKNNC